MLREFTDAFYRINIWLLLASFHLNDDDSNISINEKQKSAIADGIIWGTLTIMKQTIERKSPKQRAVYDSKPFRQSKTAITNNTISINILTDDQKYPHAPEILDLG